MAGIHTPSNGRKLPIWETLNVCPLYQFHQIALPTAPSVSGQMELIVILLCDNRKDGWRAASDGFVGERL